MDHQARLIQDNVDLLHQGLAVLEKLDDDLYARPHPDLASYGIGAHFRHCLDFYACLLRDLESRRIDFDRRERDRRVETDRGQAVEHLRELAARLLQLKDLPEKLPLQVRIDCVDDSAPWPRSTLARELKLLLSHTVHHFALVAVLLQHNDEAPPQGFGVAPATLRYWREKGMSVGGAAFARS